MSNYTNSDKSFRFNNFQNELIPGLPNDLGLECLLRVPITSHPTLRLVSYGWKSAISDTSFYTDRRRLGFAEHILCLIQPLSPPPPPPQQARITKDNHSHSPLYNLIVYNLTRCEWRRLSLPVPTFAQCVAVPAAAKVVVLGGWEPQTLEPLNRVVVVDLITGTWKEGTPMPTPRSFFAAAATSSGYVYVAGGHDGGKNALRSAEVYDVADDKWWVLPPMLEERDESQGLSFGDSKFWVVSGYSTESQGRFRSDAEVFDPETGSWSKIEGVWPYPANTTKTTVASAGGGRRRRWFFVGDGEAKEFEWEESRWKGLNLGQIPRKISGSSSIYSIDVSDEGEKIFVMGNGNGEDCDKECKEEGCGGEGVFILEMGNEDVKVGIIRWKHVHAPCRFLGIPFSASQLLI